MESFLSSCILSLKLHSPLAFFSLFQYYSESQFFPSSLWHLPSILQLTKWPRTVHLSHLWSVNHPACGRAEWPLSLRNVFESWPACWNLLYNLPFYFIVLLAFFQLHAVFFLLLLEMAPVFMHTCCILGFSFFFFFLFLSLFSFCNVLLTPDWFVVIC